MALTLGRVVAAQLIASGSGATLNVATGYAKSLYYSHLNGSGTAISPQGSAIVEGRTAGGLTWYTIVEVGFGTTANQRLEDVVMLPTDLAEVRMIYTAPGGSTGHTLDYEVGLVTGL